MAKTGCFRPGKSGGCNGKAGSTSEAGVHFCDLGLGSVDKYLKNPLADGGIGIGTVNANPSARDLTKGQSAKQ